MNKKCPCCNISKEATSENFYISKGVASSYCKQCKSIKNRERRASNYQEIRNREIASARRRRDQGKTKTKEWLHARNEWRKKWISSMPSDELIAFKEKCKKMTSDWALLNKDKIAASARRYKEKNKTNPIMILQSSIRRTIGKSITNMGYKKNQRTHEILGCTWDEFKTHIERQFHKGMSWEGRSQWELDHIIPKHTAKTMEDLIALNRFTNLRPIWKSENRKKSGKITHLI